MAGFFVEGYQERVPCPQCGGKDCAGLRSNSALFCITTGNEVSGDQLLASAMVHMLEEPYLIETINSMLVALRMFLKDSRKDRLPSAQSPIRVASIVAAEVAIAKAENRS
jgi:hypothetical protein